MKTILLVEDDANLREMISYNLDINGREVLECACGVEARALLADKGRQIDLVMLDLALLSMDGFQVTRRMKSDPILKSIPILLSTGNSPHQIIEGMSMGADDFICKPFSIERDLGVRIDVLLNRGRIAQGA